MTQRLNYVDLAPGGLAAMRGLEHWLNTASGLEPVLLELVRLRASLLNGCDYCIGMHGHELSKHHEPETRVRAVAAWRGSDAFTERERAALAWTEVITNVQQGHVPEEAFQAVREHFSDAEVVALTIAIGSIGLWNRMAIAFRAEHHPKPEAASNSHTGPKESSGPETQVSEARPGAPEPSTTAEDRLAVDDDGGKVSVED